MPVQLTTVTVVDVFLWLDTTTREVLSHVSAGYNRIYRRHLEQYTPSVRVKYALIRLGDASIDCYLNVHNHNRVPCYFVGYKFRPDDETSAGFHFTMSYDALADFWANPRRTSGNTAIRLMWSGRMSFDMCVFEDLYDQYRGRVPLLTLFDEWRHNWSNATNFMWESEYGKIFNLADHHLKRKVHSQFADSTFSWSGGGVRLGSSELSVTSSEKFFHGFYEFLHLASHEKNVRYFELEVSIRVPRRDELNCLHHAKDFMTKAGKLYAEAGGPREWKIEVRWCVSAAKSRRDAKRRPHLREYEAGRRQYAVYNPNTGTILQCDELIGFDHPTYHVLFNLSAQS